ncbi:exonuclease SbcCD subunit D [Amnibacterium kyonggiense]|uniref:Nuclease SbcCD subunit D n=1 Tax=Amnibacterium kyonggiense TaxID=595671 RepID=A0A4V3EAB3_9MICO|nr:exonuclease SbcCD subunit D [Amnibacterium kyonggiense]TDS75738.1 exodeoxyribonuclease I subunit D [Amnibacterium kyonggiense]
MRLLHTSDWHIGRTFHGHATLDALRGVLLELAAAVRREHVDAVLVAGDVFDSATPAAAAFELFEEAVLAIRAAGADVVMTSGNHDSAARLGHQAPFAAAGGVHVRTRADALDRPVVLRDEHGEVDVYGIPYLEPLLLGERTHAAALGAAMDRVRTAAAERGNRSVVLAHCFASTGVVPQAAGGERDITAGGLDIVPSSVFDATDAARIDYVALGHLHSRVRLAERVRYAGAPLHYSFGETSPVRGAWLVDLDAEGLADAAWLDLPVPRRLTEITGPLDRLLEDESLAGAEQDWVQAVLTDPVRQQDAMARLRERFPHVAKLEHRPEGVRPADARSYGERTAGLPDAALIAGFLEHVRAGAGPSDAESALVAEVLSTVAAAERAA